MLLMMSGTCYPARFLNKWTEQEDVILAAGYKNKNLVYLRTPFNYISVQAIACMKVPCTCTVTHQMNSSADVDVFMPEIIVCTLVKAW